MSERCQVPHPVDAIFARFRAAVVVAYDELASTGHVPKLSREKEHIHSAGRGLVLNAAFLAHVINEDVSSKSQ